MFRGERARPVAAWIQKAKDDMSQELIGRASAGEDLSQEDMATAVGGMMRGEWQDEQIAMLLTALHYKGETVEEVAGAAQAMRHQMTRIRSAHSRLIDTCGTGGDGSRTFNISTAAAIVTAAAGVPVAKHGNRSMTSKTGSADVLARLGVNIEASVEQSEACLETIGLCFCFAPLFHQSMKHVAAVRRQLGFRTIFNLLGPLCNPARATHQLLGVGSMELRPLLAQALQRLDTQQAIVVCGSDGLDEVTLRGTTFCSWVTSSELREFNWSPEDFGLAPVNDYTSLLVDGPSASAEIIRQVLAGEKGTARDIVIANAAAALWLAGEGTPTECATQAASALDTGKARDTLEQLARQSFR